MLEKNVVIRSARMLWLGQLPSSHAVPLFTRVDMARDGAGHGIVFRSDRVSVESVWVIIQIPCFYLSSDLIWLYFAFG